MEHRLPHYKHAKKLSSVHCSCTWTTLFILRVQKVSEKGMKMLAIIGDATGVKVRRRRVPIEIDSHLQLLRAKPLTKLAMQSRQTMFHLALSNIYDP